MDDFCRLEKGRQKPDKAKLETHAMPHPRHMRLYEIYRDCRPQEMCKDDSPFYLAVNNMLVDPSNRMGWFKNGPLGKNALGDMMKNMAKEGNLHGKFCNHSARKTSMTNLLHAGVPPTVIKHISGHKNAESISHYATASKAQVKRMNEILLNPSQNISDGPKPKLHRPDPSIQNDQSIQIQSVLPRIDNHSEMTKNQTAISGILHNSTLNNCTFHISYPIHKLNEVVKEK